MNYSRNTRKGVPYLPDLGGSCKAPRAISNSSAATSASVGGGVGKGKLTTYKCKGTDTVRGLGRTGNSQNSKIRSVLIRTPSHAIVSNLYFSL